MKKFKFEVGEKYGYFEIIEKESIVKNGHTYVTTKYQANVSKHIMSMNELYNFCTKVLNHANQQGSQPLKKLEPSETNC